MRREDFIEYCTNILVDYLNRHKEETDDTLYTSDYIYVVWVASLPEQSKALLSTIKPDNLYYECTLNYKTKELSVNVYDKLNQVKFKEIR